MKLKVWTGIDPTLEKRLRANQKRKDFLKKESSGSLKDLFKHRDKEPVDVRWILTFVAIRLTHFQNAENILSNSLDKHQKVVHNIRKEQEEMMSELMVNALIFSDIEWYWDRVWIVKDRRQIRKSKNSLTYLNLMTVLKMRLLQ